MPAATTHVEFAKSVYYLLPRDTRSEIVDMPMYFLGSQGPDLFFFSRFAVLPGSLNPYGHRMHVEKIKEVIAYLHQAAVWDTHIRSYYYGYLTHYALDSTVHPIICYAAHQQHLKDGTHEGAAHVTIEAELDTAVLKKEGRTIHDYDVYQYLKVSREDRDLLAGIYHELFKNVFDLEIEEKIIAQSVDDVFLSTKLMKPDSSVKYHFVQKMETLLKQPHALSGMMLNEKKEPVIMNEEHKEYENPGTRTGKDHSSFWQLYRKAGHVAEELIVSYDTDLITRDFMGNPIKKA